MRLSTEARQARKQAQFARLAMKGKPEYSAMYAAQPAQIARAKRYEAERAAKRAVRNAVDAAALSDARGAASVFSGVVQASTVAAA